MSTWSDKEIKLLKKLLKKGKSDREIATEFEKKGYNKNVFMIISKKRSSPELRQYFQKSEWTIDNIEDFADQLKKQKKSPES
jgi:DNA-binding winged helix-turn-helix (wHTH) protein